MNFLPNIIHNYQPQHMDNTALKISSPNVCAIIQEASMPIETQQLILNMLLIEQGFEGQKILQYTDNLLNTPASGKYNLQRFHILSLHNFDQSNPKSALDLMARKAAILAHPDTIAFLEKDDISLEKYVQLMDVDINVLSQRIGIVSLPQVDYGNLTECEANNADLKKACLGHILINLSLSISDVTKEIDQILRFDIQDSPKNKEATQYSFLSRSINQLNTDTNLLATLKLTAEKAILLENREMKRLIKSNEPTLDQYITMNKEEFTALAEKINPKSSNVFDLRRFG